ncbi:tail fiber domain-containing protein [Nonlabens marinus]|uniref:Peptidase S74 domain-containing protein n=1 Tax=Nonlabens marinus S1-08 TaxID=1454201 RepID=W8VZD9_9FLAO|nr:tail fiber domain-containing protein [Nonlabens marinus]BAO54406.1 hypothetical protein NMS_0397 [Nonlabens marinus S1-08]
MKRIILSSVFLLSTFLSLSQVGIGTNSPSSASLLDIQAASGDKGIMIPRVNIVNLSNQAPIVGAIEESLLVFNLNDATGKGFYYWSGSKWEKLTTPNDTPTTSMEAGDAWSLSGNSGTTPGGGTNNYLGTSDNTDLSIATNKIEHIRVKANGNVGIGAGATNPGNALVIKTNTNFDGLSLDFLNYDLNMIQSGDIFFMQNTQATGSINLAFGNSSRLSFDTNAMLPAVDAPNNITTNNGTYDLGRFDRHFRRMYTKGVHSNDNDANGGLRINIGSNGGSLADYHFTNFSFFAVENNRDLGRNDKPWRTLYYQNAQVVSDRRKKENIAPLSHGLDKILSLKTYSYNYKNDSESKERYGFIAQDLQTDLPAVVEEAPDEMKSLSVDYTAIIPILVNAIKEQQVQIDALKKQLQ